MKYTLLTAAVALMGLSHCGSGMAEPEGPRTGGETGSWLAQCDATAMCDEELACICGICTLPCDGDDACAGSVCTSTLVYPGADLCVAEESPPDAICVAACTSDATCPSFPNAVCLGGVCRPDTDATHPPDREAGAFAYPGTLDVWSTPFTFEPDCTCDAASTTCDALYQSSVLTLVEDVLTFRIQKLAGTGPSEPTAPISVWVNIGRAEPACDTVTGGEELAETIWSEGVLLELSVDLAGYSELATLDAGTDVFVSVVTGSGTEPATPKYWLHPAIRLVVR